MANKPVAGALGYNSTADRPTVQLSSGVKKLLTEDDAVAGGVTAVSGTGAISAAPTTGAVVVSLDKTDLEDGGSQELSVAGLSGALADGQRADKVVATGADVVISPTPPSAGQYIRASSATAAAWSSPPEASELHFPPLVADARDDEFTNITLPVGYVMYNSTTGVAMGTPIAKAALSYTAPGGGLSRYQCHTDRRPSWLNVQIDSGTNMFLLKPITLAANDFVWTRMSAHQQTTSGGGTVELLLTITAATGGHPDPANRVFFGISISNGLACFAYAQRVIAGVATNIPAAEAATLVTEARGGGHAYDFFGIDKVGTKYRFVAAAKGYRRTWTDGNAISFTPAYAGWYLRASPSDPDSTIFGMDFLRFNANGFLASPM